jgi:hypothetical protein
MHPQLGCRTPEASEALTAAYPTEMAAFRAQRPVRQQLLPALAAGSPPYGVFTSNWGCFQAPER